MDPADLSTAGPAERMNWQNLRLYGARLRGYGTGSRSHDPYIGLGSMK